MRVVGVQVGAVKTVTVGGKTERTAIDKRAVPGGAMLRTRGFDGDACAQKYHGTVESWNEAGSSYVWVRVPQIAAAADNDFVWLYYGNPKATSAEDWKGTYDPDTLLAYQEIVALVTNGTLAAEIDATFRLEQHADALSRAEHYRRSGKVLFTFGDRPSG